MLPEKISDEDKQTTLQDLNRIIQCRLALSELPVQMKGFKIGKIRKNKRITYLNKIICIKNKENGSVTFCVKNEFDIKLTLISDDFNLPWRVLKINFLVRDSQDPSNKETIKKRLCRIHFRFFPQIDFWFIMRKQTMSMTLSKCV